MAVTTSRGLDPHPTDQRTLRTFFVATFALSWGVGVLLSVLPALVPALLQRRMAPPWSALLLGVVVAVRHAPAFLLSGTKQRAWAIGPSLLGIVAISFILTNMFNASRGSLLVAVLFNAQVNGSAGPDAQPKDMYLVAVVHRTTVLSRAAGHTTRLFDAGPVTARP